MDFPPGFALLQHHRRLTARLSGRMDRGDAEDLASEAIARGLHHPPPDGRQAPWLERIWQNLLVDRGRRARRRAGERAWRGGFGGDPPSAVIERLPSAERDPEQALLAAERVRALATALPRMPAELREAVIARFYLDHDYGEMAAASGISAGAARTRVHRALARLRRNLARLRGWLPLSLGSGGAAPSATSLVPALLTAMVAAPALLPAGAVAGRPAASPPALSAQQRLTRTHARAARRASGEVAGPLVLPRPSAAPAPATAETAAAAAAPLSAPPSPPSPPSPASPPAPSSPAAAPAPSPRHRTLGLFDAVAPGEASAVRRFDFDDDEVEGTLHAPDDILLTGDPRRAHYESLIEIPASFDVSTAKMVEDL